jgi:signal transduction histidine kinase/phage shock protein PspC (stress-responsive transcriptional regulator)
MVAGVAGGLSGRLGLDTTVVRVAFVLLTIAGGTGLAVYVVAWLLVPRDGDEHPAILQRALADRRTLALALAMAVAMLAVLLALEAVGAKLASGLVWPLSLGVVGLVLVWRGAGDDEKAFLREVYLRVPIAGSGRRRRSTTVARIALGMVLVGVGLGLLAATRRPAVAVFDAFSAAAMVVGGFLVVFGPWWFHLARDLAEEHRERVRVEERADVASTVHDSVLQTLALIQRSAGDQREVTRLARAQERDLRAWLFEGRAPGSFDAADITTLSEAITAIERDVEAAHGVAVDGVAVGDCPLTDDLEALLAAGREAAVNAAKWSGQDSVSLFVEVEPTKVSLFVRDRGRGFDPESVAEDRRGISQSIRARMQRHGGTTTIRSGPDQGTEVELVMPRSEVKA